MTSTTFFSEKIAGKRSQLMLACLLILTAILAACGSNSSKTANTTLVMQANQSGDYPRNFNPYAGSVVSGTQGLIYETMLMFNRIAGTSKPWLATSTTISSDAKTITFNLRKGVKWSDGQAFSSADVVFTLNLLKKYPSLDLNGIDSYIKSVVAPDANTVTVTLTQPYYPILWYLGGQTFILPQHIWSKVKGDPSQFADPNPVGTGPYTLKTFTPQLVTLARNASYWQADKAKVTLIKIPAFNDNTSDELALEHGQVDWTNLYIQNVQKSYVDKDPKHNHYWYPSSDVVYLYLNLKKAPFDQLAIRTAISDAINRDQLNTVGEGGYEPAATPTSLLPADAQYLLPAYKGLKFTFSTANAMSALQGAGYAKDSSGIFAKNGKELAFNLNVVSGFNDWINDAQLMEKSLDGAGMKVTVNTIDYNTYYDKLQQGDFDTAMLWTSAGPSPYYLYNGLLNSANSAPIGQAASTNYERWMDPTTDKLLQDYATSTNPAAQTQAIQGLEKIMVEQLPSIPLTFEPYWGQYSTAKFTGWPSASDPYQSAGTLEPPDTEDVILHLQPVNP